MKRTVFIWVASALSVLGVMAADITPIADAFKGGNAASLSGRMDKEVDIALSDNSKKCNADEAVAMLDAFFGHNRPKGFKVVHHADKAGNGFFVGKLPTASKEYRVNVTYRTEGDKAVIQSIRIE